MATDLKAPRHEQFVERQIARATRHIHVLDIGRSVLWLLAATLGFALAMAMLDFTFGRQEGTWGAVIEWARFGAWGVYVAGAIALTGLLVLRLFRRINPYYAARQIEDALPDAKNSVVNWLDLREEKLPPAIKTALGLRAAHDLKDADPEQVGAHHSWLLVTFTVLLVLGLAVLLVKSGPGQFASMMQRAFLPIQHTAVASPTEISLFQPDPPDAIVAPQQNIVFRAAISGAVPRINTAQAPRLQYRYQDKDSWATPLPLEQDLDGAWAVTMHADLVQNGFYYKLSAGEAETPTHEVKVRSLPQARKFEVKYHFQPYLRLPDIAMEALSPRIKAHRGTEVTLVVHANHPLREGAVELHADGDPIELIAGDIDANDPSVYRVKFPLLKSGSLRVLFTSRAGADNSDRSSYPIQVLADLPPSVALTLPGKDVVLPANGTLQLEGTVNDDFGIKNMTLHLKIVQGPSDAVLAPKPYRPGVALQFADGAYPDYLEYKDFVALDQLKSSGGAIVPLAKGTVLAYWLEATDNCGFPSRTGNVGKSNIYHVTIADPQDDKKQQEERQQANQDQKRHDQDQDQDVKQQEQDRADNRQRTAEERRKERDVREKTDRLKNEIKKQDDAQKDQPSGNDGNDTAAEKTTLKDVDNLEKKLKQNGPEAEGAAEKLEQAADKAKDDKVRQAAQKALKDNGLDQEPPAKDLTPKDIDNLKEKQKEPGPQGEAAERKLAKAADQASDPKTRAAAKEALKEAIKNLTEKDIENLREKLKQKGPQADRAEDKLKKAAESAEDQQARAAAEQALKDAINDLSAKDIEDLSRKLKGKGPQADRAEDKLAKAAEGAKDQKARDAAGKALQDAIKNLTEKDVKNLQEKVKQDGAPAEAAADKLAKAAEEARDPKARDAAEQAFKDLVKNLNEKDIDHLKEKMKQNGPQAGAAERKLAKAAEDAKDEKAREAAGKALKDAIKNLSAKDIENLKEKLKNTAEADAAEKKLSKAADQAQDPKAREAADKALKDAIKNLSPQDIENLKEKLKRNGAERAAAEDKLAKAAEGAQDPKVREAADKALQDARQGKEFTEKDLDNLKKALTQKGSQGAAAGRELAKAAEQTKDPKMRQAIEDALKEAGREPASAAAQATPKDVEKLSDALKQQGSGAEAAARELAKVAEQAKDPAAKKAAEEALKEAGRDKNAVKQPDMQDIAKLAKQAEEKGPLGSAAVRELAKAANQASDPAVQKAAKEALAKRKSDPQAAPEPTQQEIRDLQEMLKQKGPAAEDAARALAKAAQDAKDPAVKKQAAAALKQHGRDPQSARQPTKDDVAQLKEMQKKKGLIGEVATKELEKIAKLAQDSEVRKEAQDALRDAHVPAPERTAEDVAFLKHLLEQKGPLADFARHELAKMADDDRHPNIQKLAKAALRSDPPEPSNTDPALTKRAGQLQLEDLKKLPADVWKKAGFSEKDWKQYLKDIEAYEASHPRDAGATNDAQNKKGDPGKLSSVGPQQVNPSANPTLTPTQSGRGQPPPGFRELYQRWTVRPPSPEK